MICRKERLGKAFSCYFGVHLRRRPQHISEDIEKNMSRSPAFILSCRNFLCQVFSAKYFVPEVFYFQGV